MNYDEINKNRENEQNAEMIDKNQLLQGTIEENTEINNDTCTEEKSKEIKDDASTTEEAAETSNECIMQNEIDKSPEGNTETPEEGANVLQSVSNASSGKTSNTTNCDINSIIKSTRPKSRRKGQRNFKKYVAVALVSSIISSSLVGGGLYYGFSKQLEKQNQAIESLSTFSTVTNKSNIVQAVASTNNSGGSTVTRIAKEVGPSIVGIRMTVKTSQRSFYNNTLSSAEGSGIIISKDGYIMTNYHVVKYADPKASTSSNTTLEVFLSDGTQTKAKFVGGDSETDLALIKVELKNLPVATLGDSSKLQVGELAVAIGNPLGLEFAGSVTVGVISALNRSIESADAPQNLIQTDAAINPGNSGGALLNSKGEVIGINSAKISEEGVEGLGFAIPINDVKPIINQLMMFGYVKGRPFIGISGQDVTETISRAYGFPVGIYVAEVTEGSGADYAGIQRGDIITAIDGKSVTTMEELNSVKKEYKAGDTVTVTVVRNGKTLNLKLTFSEQR